MKGNLSPAFYSRFMLFAVQEFMFTAAVKMNITSSDLKNKMA